MVLEKAKKLSTTAFRNSISRIMANASPETLSKMWGLFEKISDTESDKRQARRFRWLVKQGHPFGKWLQRMSDELNDNARKSLIRNLYGNAWFLNRKKREDFGKKHGYAPPYIMVIDVTARCNLSCQGCWAAMYGKESDLDYNLLEQMITEAEDEMGMHFFVFSGGEPTIRNDLYELYANHPESQFQIYTNGTLIDKEMAAKFAELGNVMPMVSIDGNQELTDERRGNGTYDKVMRAMDNLKEQGVLFGFSATGTRYNVNEIMSEEFVEKMIGKGCLYGWYFQYIPVGRDPDITLMVTPQQREHMRKQVYNLRNKYPIFLSDFWNDGVEVNGCMAGGRRYFHVNNEGDIEPCVFCHFAIDNAHEKSLTEALKHPFFKEIRDEIPYDGNLLRPCMLIDRPEVFRKHAERYGATPTHIGADTLIKDLAEPLDQRAAEWAEIAEKAWQEGDYYALYPYPPGEDGKYRSLHQ